MDANEAATKVEEWMRTGTSRDLTAGDNPLRVDRDNVVRTPEGWLVPYNAVAYLDGGDLGAGMIPMPAIVVTEPDGVLREADPHPRGPSQVLDDDREEYWAEILNREFAESDLGYLGVPNKAVMAWRKVLPDGTETDEIRPNPEWSGSPGELGYPPMDTPLDHLLTFYACGWFDRAKYLIGVLGAELLVPVDEQTGKPSHTDGRAALIVFSSRTKLPPGTTKWLVAGTVSVMDRFPNVGLSINPGLVPGDVVTADELAATRAEWPNHQPTPVHEELSPERSDSVRWTIHEARQKTGVDGPIVGLDAAQARARWNGYELTQSECAGFVFGRAWEQRNESAPAVEWPADLRANGLIENYDANGNVLPRVRTFGKFFRLDVEGARFAWHRIAGAFVGFALGDAAGAPDDTASLAEIEAKYGPQGIPTLGAAFDKPGQFSALTQRLLFHTEALIRARIDGNLGDGFDAIARESLTRWRATSEGQVDGLAGWLPKVTDLHAVRVTDTGEAADAVALLVPGLVAALCADGPGTPTAVAVARRTVAACGGDELTADGAAVLAELFAGLFGKARTIAPVHVLVHAMAERLRDEPGDYDQRTAAMLADVVRIRTDSTAGEREEIERADYGHPALTALGRALAAVSRLFFDPHWTILAAVNHSGPSAITGALAGALAGARAGIPGLPQAWLPALEGRGLLENMAGDAFWHFSPTPPSTDQRYREEWLLRYPRG
ncbi:ADP-ribosylglycohydrolase family protein [Herbihabitans rhizosphaerae]|uniref:ADP-ribosylglycohydrolase family protein n=1 Tax=Herbihabitans rhizosphaerae TaxID=1872711 RepID=UPI001A90E5FB|nr:ADP-ribosylglycohydrolase family protein [Herbihabitans rhizosphaerae]